MEGCHWAELLSKPDVHDLGHPTCRCWASYVYSSYQACLRFVSMPKVASESNIKHAVHVLYDSNAQVLEFSACTVLVYCTRQTRRHPLDHGELVLLDKLNVKGQLCIYNHLQLLLLAMYSAEAA